MSDNADERTTVAASDETTRVKPVVAVVGRPNVGKSSWSTGSSDVAKQWWKTFRG